MALVSGILLTLYLCAVLYAMLSPPKPHDAPRRVTVGCLGVIVGGIALVLAVLVIGEVYDRRAFVYVAFAMAVVPLIGLIPMSIGAALKWRERRGD